MAGFVVLVELFAFARPHGDVPGDVKPGIRALFNAPVACVPES